MKIKISDIKPVGNFKEILEELDKQVTAIENAVDEYSDIISDMIKKIVNLEIIDQLEKSISDKTVWDIVEAKTCLLYTHILIMRMNNLANKYLNKWLTIPSDFEQLTDYIQTAYGFTREAYHDIIILREDGWVQTRVVHKNKEPFDVYIGRPSKWGNPYTHKKSGSTRAKYVKETRDEAIEAYRDYIEHGEGIHLIKDLHELKGKVLGCWCKHHIPGKPENSCHGDILVEMVEKYCK